jgi:hypothetical protein
MDRTLMFILSIRVTQTQPCQEPLLPSAAQHAESELSSFLLVLSHFSYIILYSTADHHSFSSINLHLLYAFPGLRISSLLITLISDPRCLGFCQETLPVLEHKPFCQRLAEQSPEDMPSEQL